MKKHAYLAIAMMVALPALAATGWAPQGAQAQNGVNDLVDGALEWNGNYAQTATITGGIFLGTIQTAADRALAFDAVLQLDYVAAGDFTDPSTVEILDASEDIRVTRSQYNTWRAAADSAVQIGLDAYLVNWQVSDVGAISTIALVDDQTVVWESILQSVSYVEDEFGPGTLSGARSSMSRRITWLWGSTRGRINASIRAVCDGDEIRCVKTCDAWMSLGSATIRCEVKKDGDCCTLDYSYGWGTPLVDVEVARDGFTVSAKGIGSKGEGNGTLLDCCD